MLLSEMQTAHATDQERSLFVESVLPTVQIVEADGLEVGVAKVDLPLNDIVPGGRKGIFKIRHEYLYICVQCVDHHFAINRSGDLNAPIAKIRRDVANAPRTFADGPRFGQEIRQGACIHFVLERHACL